MPPKPKFGKAEIINAGLTIAKNEGLESSDCKVNSQNARKFGLSCVFVF